MTGPEGGPPREATLAEAIREWTRIIVVAILAWLLIRTFLLEAFRIPSSSMENTLMPGDRLFVNKAVFGPQVPGLGLRLPAWREPAYGDVLVFDSVEEDIKVVKRLIGLPGDTLEMRGGVLYRNGLRQAEPYVRHEDPDRSDLPEARLRMRAWQLPHLLGDTAGYAPDVGAWGPLVVPPDSLFLLGDNREHSYDSRYWGLVARTAVRGTPWFIYYSYDPTSWQRFRVFTTLRWERLFTRPR
jgi:signal peptidase I